MPSDRVREILPPDTAATWDAIAPLIPTEMYLGDGTAIAVHLGHRISRDLDFFFHHRSVDLGELDGRLSAAGPFAVTERAPGTLNGVFSATRIQFLHADEGRPQHLLEPPQEIDCLRVAGLSDLMAMKLKVVGDRGELRDYFDLMTIEQRTGRTADEGLALFVARFRPEYPQRAINHILLGLGYFDDVDPDDALPVPRAQIVDYWIRRQREIIMTRGRLSTIGSIAGEYVERYAALDPLGATYLGITGHDHELADLSADGFAARAELDRSTLAALAAAEAPGPREQVARAAMAERLALDVERYDAGDVTSELNVIASWAQWVRQLFDLMPADGEEAAVNVARRMAAVPEAYRQFSVTLLGAARNGRRSQRAGSRP